MTDFRPESDVAPEGEPRRDAAAPPEGSAPDQSAPDLSVPEAEGPAETGEDAGAGDEELEDDLTRAKRDLAGLTSDLQRLQAEYLNYKRRVERDRELVRENATYAALVPIVEVLDTIDRAREHGDLDPGFQTVADQLERVVAKQGLARFGEPGDPFDPSLHEALSHVGQDPEVSVTTCKLIAKAGYRIGDRVVRAAQVLVVDPADEQQ
ncbi:nucleotide exchange factor GrpE [Nocardioides panaciterrulae]|uniref:Protein GrpE n=1 Tax=Nocardioides panaciterrulae TaxID=661492 RepID=A0A7Y9E3E0_9ACTN|nr:molecular chaperone GrpE [Nocardioides panaciterrulae]